MPNSKVSEIKVENQIAETSTNDEMPQQINSIIETLSVHGVSNFFRAKNKLFKILWALLLIQSVLMCSIMIIETITLYLSNETIFVTDSEILKETKFPGITLCNRNQRINISEMLLRCEGEFGSCNDTEFTKTDIYNVTCYSLNMFKDHGKKFMVYTHSNSSLSIDIFTGVNDDLQDDESGIRVMISNHSQYADFSQGFDVSSGKF